MKQWMNVLFYCNLMLSRDRAFIKWLFFSAGTLFICVCLKVKVMLLCRQCSRLGRQSELSSVGNWVEAEAWGPLRALKGVLCVWVTFRWKSQRTFGPVCERSVGANTELPPWNSGSKCNRHIYMRGRKLLSKWLQQAVLGHPGLPHVW